MLTTKDAAEGLPVNEASIRVWLNDEEEKARSLPNAVKFGCDWQIPLSDVDKLPAGRTLGRPPKDKTEPGSKAGRNKLDVKVDLRNSSCGHAKLVVRM